MVIQTLRMKFNIVASVNSCIDRKSSYLRGIPFFTLIIGIKEWLSYVLCALVDDLEPTERS